MNSDIPVSTMDKTLQGIESLIVYALATRNCAELACVCLRSLDRAHLSAFPGTSAQVYVLDDSTSVDASSQLQSHINSTTLRALQARVLTAQTYFGFRANVMARFPSTSELFSRLCRAPGTPGWNLSSARNFLYLFLASLYAAQQVVCFVDDDVICTPVDYYGGSFSPTVPRVLRRAVLLARTCRYLAVGPRFLGCEDIPIARSLIKAFHRLHTGVPERGFPYFTALSSKDLDTTDPVPSGGLMLTTVESLRVVPLMPFYNEDWIWGQLVSLTPNSYVARIRGFAVHAPPHTAEPNAEDLVFQEIGEALYEAVAQLARRSKDLLSSPAQILGSLTQTEIEYQLRRRVRVLRRYKTEIGKLTGRTGCITTDSFHLRQKREWSLELLKTAAGKLAEKDPGDVLESVRVLLPLMILWKDISAHLALQSQCEQAIPAFS